MQRHPFAKEIHNTYLPTSRLLFKNDQHTIYRKTKTGSHDEQDNYNNYRYVQLLSNFFYFNILFY